ncbi:prenyltransferase [Leptospira sp. WS39.C2]
MFRTNQTKGTFLFFKFITYGSLDVVISVFANLSFFSLYTQTPLRVSLLLLYLISVWALYLLDHLWDAKKEKDILSPRSVFFLEHQIKFQWMISFFFLCSSGLVFFWEWKFLVANQIFLFSFGMTLVLVVTRFSPLPKEIWVSLFYTWGILLPFPTWFGSFEICLVFFLHVFANVLYTYNLDREIDLRQNTFVFSRFLTHTPMLSAIRILLGIGSFLVLFLNKSESHPLVFQFGIGLSYLWLLLTTFLKGKVTTLKSLAELSYLPMFLPQIIFFFSGLR